MFSRFRMSAARGSFRCLSIALAAALLTSALVLFPAGAAGGQESNAGGPREFNPAGSLPEVAKKINQLSYPTFGNPAIARRGEELVIEWDWRLGNGAIPLSALPRGGKAAWEVRAVTSVAANVQQYDGSTNDPADWYRYRNPADPYGYGTYDRPVHTVVNTRLLEVKKVERKASARWPELFGQTGFVLDHLTVRLPADLPVDLYDLAVTFKGRIPAGYRRLLPPGHEGRLSADMQPHALSVVEGFDEDLRIIQITDTHVYGQEIQNAFRVNYSSFELREPRPGTPARPLDCFERLWLKYDDFPLDADGDGRTNEGAIYLQEQLQAINLLDPDFVVFTGDSTFAQKNWNTYPKNAVPFECATGDVGSEYRFEMPWWYDELLALNVPVFCVPGNHDGYCWDGHEAEGGLARDDGLEIWQDLFGPLFRSWDYGDCHFLGVNTMDWPKSDPTPEWTGYIFPELEDRNGMNLFGYIINPHKYLGQVRGNGDEWGAGAPPPGTDLRWSPGDPAAYDGQLGWIRRDLEASRGKKLRGMFMHHDPLKEIGSDPEMFDNQGTFNIPLPSGRGEGSQALVHLMRSFNVAFEASGHAHSDWVGRVPWYDGTGHLTALNTTACEIPVGNEALTDKASAGYAGFRMITISEGALAGWGLPGADGDPMNRWSIPGWKGIGVGTASPDNPAPNGFEVYRANRPSVQWMEQDASPLRPAVVDGEGSFSTPSLPGRLPLPLNDRSTGGPFEDVTCKVRNTLDGSGGAALDLVDCRIEFPVKKLEGGRYYAVENGRILEQYDADTGERMVVVLADVPAGALLPVRVYAAGPDLIAPSGALSINGGAAETRSRDVTLAFSATDGGGSGVCEYRVANSRAKLSTAAWLPYTGDGSIPWKLAGGEPGKRAVFVQFRDAAMPPNVSPAARATIELAGR